MGFAEVSMMDDRIALSLGASVTSVREPLGSADLTLLRLVRAADTPPGKCSARLGPRCGGWYGTCSGNLGAKVCACGDVLRRPAIGPFGETDPMRT